MQFSGLAIAAVVAIFAAPLVVLLGEFGLAHGGHNVTMPETIRKIHLFLAAVRPDRAGEHGVHAWESLIQDGCEAVLEGHPQLHVLVILAITGFEKKSDVILRRKRSEGHPAVNGVVGNFNRVSFVGLDLANCVTTIVMDYANKYPSRMEIPGNGQIIAARIFQNRPHLLLRKSKTVHILS